MKPILATSEPEEPLRGIKLQEKEKGEEKKQTRKLYRENLEIKSVY